MILFLFFRKHSSGDLHSRLKTRKLLGVGETDDGDVHRSKVRIFIICLDWFFMGVRVKCPQKKTD
jgi:hypothetical protein